MSVDAIQQLMVTEQKAAQLLREAEAEIQKEKAQSQANIDHFKEELAKQTQIKKEAIKAACEAEFQKIRQPVIENTQKEVTTLRKISPELKEKALEIIIEKVVK